MSLLLNSGPGRRVAAVNSFTVLVGLFKLGGQADRDRHVASSATFNKDYVTLNSYVDSCANQKHMIHSTHTVM